MSIENNLKRILESINQCAIKNSRDPAEIKLIVVSKNRTVAEIQKVINAGQLLFGENRVQEMIEKKEKLPIQHWHLIGNLQKNKVKYIAPFIDLIHSVDSLELAEEIQKQANKINRIISCLIQINISDEKQKSGCKEEDAEKILINAHNFPCLAFKGLMGIAENTENTMKIAKQFERLRLAKENLSYLNSEKNILTHLSMGMSHDYEEAIAEGATMIRIGSAIFENN